MTKNDFIEIVPSYNKIGRLCNYMFQDYANNLTEFDRINIGIGEPVLVPESEWDRFVEFAGRRHEVEDGIVVYNEKLYEAGVLDSEDYQEHNSETSTLKGMKEPVYQTPGLPIILEPGIVDQRLLIDDVYIQLSLEPMLIISISNMESGVCGSVYVQTGQTDTRVLQFNCDGEYSLSIHTLPWFVNNYGMVKESFKVEASGGSFTVNDFKIVTVHPFNRNIYSVEKEKEELLDWFNNKRTGYDVKVNKYLRMKRIGEKSNVDIIALDAEAEEKRQRLSQIESL